MIFFNSTPETMMIFPLERNPLTIVIAFGEMLKLLLNHFMTSLLAFPLMGLDFTFREKLPSVFNINLFSLLDGFTRTDILANFHTTVIE